ncbi:hypothetical protein C8J55DRAFT_487089 [Lentinula edodes]|uniref:Uncharacterized protein n=1 Tax=Lentinula lateritia TaxID=40482 RepID=A0A9W9ARC8_9AGAR|nr:hypothetical protein C8J55DRAFT_487089 [Lentinula edodes]
MVTEGGKWVRYVGNLCYIQYDCDKKDVRGETVTEWRAGYESVCTKLRAPAYEYIFKNLGMNDIPALVHAADTWTEEGGRVFVLVKRLQVGKQGQITSRGNVHNDISNDERTRRLFIDNVSKMRNLTELVVTNEAISSSIVSLASNLPNLRILSLEGVCIPGADVEMFTDDVQAQHVRLVNICWHGRKRDGDVIRACKKLKTLEVSWDKKWKDVNDSCEKWSNVTCESMTIYSNRSAWSIAPAEQDDERRTLIAWLRLFKNTKSLHIRGWIPQFRDADAMQDPLSNTMEELVAPMRFLKLSRRLSNLKSIKVSDVGLKSGEVDETTLSVGRVTTMEVNVFTSDKEILCRMLGALNNIRKLKVHICDDVIDTDDVLESVADMLDFNPPIEKLTITANDTLRTNITHEHFRKFKQLCGGLQHIEIGDRLWTIKQGAWNEQIGEC